MSITSFLNRAEADLASGDWESALTNALIAVAATSKLRYPNVGDRRAFVAFLKDEFAENIQPNVAIIGGYFKVHLGGQLIEIEEILYKFVRCHLLHEADVSPQLCFVEPAEGLSISYADDGRLQIGKGVIEILVRIVREAPESQER